MVTAWRGVPVIQLERWQQLEYGPITILYYELKVTQPALAGSAQVSRPVAERDNRALAPRSRRARGRLKGG